MPVPTAAKKRIGRKTVIEADLLENIPQIVEEYRGADNIVVGLHFYSTTNATGAMLRPGVAQALGVLAPWRGSLLMLTFKSNSDASGTYSFLINGKGKGAKVKASSEQTKQQAFLQGEHGFRPGDILNVTASNTATSTPVEVTAYVRYYLIGVI